MAISKKIEITCEVCRWPAKTFDNESAAKAEGWTFMGYECYYTDRDFHTATICPECSKKIHDAVQKRCTCSPGHICDGNRGHHSAGCSSQCPIHGKSWDMVK